MAEEVGEAGRIKFTARRVGGLQQLPRALARRELAALMQRLEQRGLLPVLDDGLVGGNCALAAAGGESAAATRAGGGDASSSPDDPGWPPGSLLVSRSGKAPGAVLGEGDWVLLTSFDTSAWAAEYRSTAEERRPTSDAPLHAAALGAGAADRYGWARAPVVAVHGHALAAGEGLDRARRAGLPVSEEATLFSTPADLAALEALFRWVFERGGRARDRRAACLALAAHALPTAHPLLTFRPPRRAHPYPAHRCYVRRGHGFTVLAGSVAEAAAYFDERLLPLL